MWFNLECLYCGYKWDKQAYSARMLEEERCSKCGDLTLKIRDRSLDKVDYYCGTFDNNDKGYNLIWPKEDK